jgi:CTP synthase (UTP-ammonia lyase)
MHVSLVPVLGVVGEQKTKPTQQTVRELRALGLTPDVILCRSAAELTVSTKQKISMFCHVPVEVCLLLVSWPISTLLILYTLFIERYWCS